jgi:hypothetical protein
VLDLAARLMPLLLAGDHPTCAVLRSQYARARIREIRLSGVGFFVEYEVPAGLERTVPATMSGGSVNIQLEGVEYGAGCVLFVRGGVISMLEGYTYGSEQWPEHAAIGKLGDVEPLVPHPRGGRHQE